MHFDYHIFDNEHFDMAWSSFEQFKNHNLTQSDLCDYFLCWTIMLLTYLTLQKFNNKLWKLAMLKSVENCWNLDWCLSIRCDWFIVHLLHCSAAACKLQNDFFTNILKLSHQDVTNITVALHVWLYIKQLTLLKKGIEADFTRIWSLNMTNNFAYNVIMMIDGHTNYHVCPCMSLNDYFVYFYLIYLPSNNLLS